MQAPALAAHEEGHIDGLLDVPASLLEDLPHFARHVARVLLLAVAQDLAETVQNLAPLRARHEAPGLVGLGGDVDRLFRIALVGVGEAADEVGDVGGVAVLERSAGAGGNPFPRDPVFVDGYG